MGVEAKTRNIHDSSQASISGVKSSPEQDYWGGVKRMSNGTANLVEAQLDFLRNVTGRTQSTQGNESHPQIIMPWDIGMHFAITIYEAGMKHYANNLRHTERFAKVLEADVPLGLTPKDLVWEHEPGNENGIKLYRYKTPEKLQAERKPIPIMRLFSYMNDDAIYDLRPGKSVTEYLANQGYDIFQIDLGKPGLEERNRDFAFYVHDILPKMVELIKDESGQKELSIMAWCLGGLTAVEFAALYPNVGVRNLVLMTTPLDLKPGSGGFHKMANDPNFNVDILLAATGGIVPGELIDLGAKMLKPFDNFIGIYQKVWEATANPDDPKSQRAAESIRDMRAWASKLTSLPGKLYRELIEEYYRKNNLVKGEIELRGARVDLANVNANVLAIVAKKDHIVPPEQTLGAFDLFGSQDKTVIELEGGHIGSIVGSEAKNNAWPKLDEWLASRSHVHKGRTESQVPHDKTRKRSFTE